eukprot:825867-Pelagomonas_calceolata.AAC.4
MESSVSTLLLALRALLPSWPPAVHMARACTCVILGMGGAHVHAHEPAKAHYLEGYCKLSSGLFYTCILSCY